MPFYIVQNDITRMQVDAVVNAANPGLRGGDGGVDGAVHRAAGPALGEYCRTLGGCRVGQVKATPGFGLAAKFVIHVSGPVWRDGKSGEEALLRQCYDRALALALEHKCASVAFPLLAAGTYGFPRDRALRIAEAAFRDFLADHEMMIWLVVFDRKSFQVSEALFRSVESFLDETYVEEKLEKEYGDGGRGRRLFHHLNRREERENLSEDASSVPLQAPTVYGSAMNQSPAAGMDAEKKPTKADLEERLRKLDRGFSETLLDLIDATGEKDSAIYKRANVDRKLFSKIKTRPDYTPTKQTVLAFAFALGLDLEQTKDLLAKAGHAMSHSNRFDVIVEYFLLRREYDLFQVNEVLFAFDQPLIGA